jgi:hypothetical protein
MHHNVELMMEINIFSKEINSSTIPNIQIPHMIKI